MKKLCPKQRKGQNNVVQGKSLRCASRLRLFSEEPDDISQQTAAVIHERLCGRKVQNHAHDVYREKYRGKRDAKACEPPPPDDTGLRRDQNQQRGGDVAVKEQRMHRECLAESQRERQEVRPRDSAGKAGKTRDEINRTGSPQKQRRRDGINNEKGQKYTQSDPFVFDKSEKFFLQLCLGYVGGRGCRGRVDDFV